MYILAKLNTKEIKGLSEMLKKLHLLLIAIAFIATSLHAEIELNPTHPNKYIVQKGDTLWDISARFLKSPWVWPEVWHANPQIENPHLIYPGDEINLIYIDGQPRIQVNRGHPTLKLSPKGRTISHESAIPTIPLALIEPFLQKLRILDKAEIDAAPYVVAIEEGHLRAANPNLVYVKNLHAKQGDLFAIVRPTIVYKEVPNRRFWKESTQGDKKIVSSKWSKLSITKPPVVTQGFWKSVMRFEGKGTVLGYEVQDIATAHVTYVGDKNITTMKIDGNLREIIEGDLVLPLNNDSFDAFFQPKAATVNDDNIRVVALNNAIFRSGKWQIIALSRGLSSGISTGDVFEIFRPERIVRDNVMHPKGDIKTFFTPSKAKVELPAEYLANVMVFKAFDKISYAIIVEGDRPVKLYDYVRLP